VSLHYYFPWAIRALVAWCAFCTVTERPMRINQTTRDFFAIADDETLAYEDKLERYGTLAERYFDTAAFEEFRAETLPHLDELVVEYAESDEFDRLIVNVILTEEPPHKQERLIERSRTAVRAWAADERVAARS
jgi:hypothetical protein